MQSDIVSSRAVNAENPVRLASTDKELPDLVTSLQSLLLTTRRLQIHNEEVHD